MEQQLQVNKEEIAGWNSFGRKKKDERKNMEEKKKEEEVMQQKKLKYCWQGK